MGIMGLGTEMGLRQAFPITPWLCLVARPPHSHLEFCHLCWSSGPPSAGHLDGRCPSSCRSWRGWSWGSWTPAALDSQRLSQLPPSYTFLMSLWGQERQGHFSHRDSFTGTGREEGRRVEGSPWRRLAGGLGERSCWFSWQRPFPISASVPSGAGTGLTAWLCSGHRSLRTGQIHILVFTRGSSLKCPQPPGAVHRHMGRAACRCSQPR